MAAIRDFFRDCNIMADTSDNFDTFLEPLSFSQQKVLLKCTDYCENDNGSEEVNH